ncbi:glycosyltransferase family 2 protein [Syntrophus aciditrophicus]|uniref:Glycosyltransferase n=1 Tax=Syntrophus aciditrophicus (strain SB) TaxID=56780 RepID=Q2LPU2_SYNAS|nr:glycosyltransferase family 2 protein [Syntrophus aciditrophicus]ABC76304.1 glycosyltransferase [Syntrophus aciditrophicus SB]
MDLVSIIIPAYNAEATLKRCLDSVFFQTYREHQVIVINDGSTDNTRGIASEYKDAIEYIEQDNQGPGRSRNVGLGRAKGSFIAFLDADDYWLPAFLSKCLIFMKENHDAAAVTTGQYIKLWGHSDIIRPPILNEPSCRKVPFIIDNFFSFWAAQNHVVTGASLIRRNVIERAGYQRTDFRVCEDLEYWGYLATFGKWGFIPEVLWIGDPTPAVASQGWLKKHLRRWANLPTLDQWEKRILPRLSTEDLPGFHRVKGRVAASLVHQNILAGNDREAKRILNQLGNNVPESRIMKLLQTGIKGGAVGWYLVCQMIRLRERLKSNAVAISSRHISR